MKKNLCIVLVLLGVGVANAQWTKGKGNGYFKLNSSLIVSDEHFTVDGKDGAPNPTTGLSVTSLYGEYGITEKLDVVAYIPFLAHIYQNTVRLQSSGEVNFQGGEETTVADFELGARYQIFKNDVFAISSLLKLGIPTGETSGGPNGTLATGDGEFNQLLQAEFGASKQVFNQNSYAKLTVGVNNRTEGFSDEFHFGAELGTQFVDKLWLIGRLNIVDSFRNGDDDAVQGSEGFFVNNVEYTNLGIEASYLITNKFGVSAGVTKPIAGSFVFVDPIYSVGVFLDLK